MIGDNDNGKEPSETVEEMARREAFKGTVVKLSELQRQDGLIAESIDKSIQHNQSIIMTTITAVSDDKDYRQILKQANWRSTEEMDLYCHALAVCDFTGAVMARKHLLDRITAHSAGEGRQAIRDGLEALTHTTFTTQHDMEKKNKWGNNDRNKSSSPID